MVQQTAVLKNGRLSTFWDGLFGGNEDSIEAKKDIEFLTRDYIDFTGLASNLSSHSKWIPYPFLIDRIKRIADEVRAFAELSRAKVSELGGQIPPVTNADPAIHRPGEIHPQTNYDLLGQNIKRLVHDMESHSVLCESLQHQRNLIKDRGVADLINRIFVDMQKQEDELLDVVMKIS